MATISTSQDLDSAARTAGEAMTIQSGAVLTINTDTRYHKNAPASGTGSLGSFTMSSTTGGECLIDGRNVRWLPFTSGSGLVPAYDTNVVGFTSGATGKLLGVYTALNSAPTAVGGAMPASGFIKLKSASTSYNASESLTLGMATATTNGVDVTGWIEVVLDDAANITIARAQKFTVRSDWFYLDNTTGASQIIQLPTCGGGADTMYPGVWIEESAPRSATYTWADDYITVTLASHGYHGRWYDEDLDEWLEVGTLVEVVFTSGDGTPNGGHRVYSTPTSNTFTFPVAGSGAGGNCTITVFEFWPSQRYGAALSSGWYSTAKGTDARNKFVEMQDGGAVRIGANTSGAYGYIPASGLRVRIPNVLMMSCATASRAVNSLPHATITSRPEFTVTGAGNIDIQGCLSTWHFNITQPYSTIIKNTAVVDNIILNECATAFTLEEFHTGNYLNNDITNINFASNLAGGTVTKCKFGRTGTMASGDYGAYISYCKDITFTDCHFQNRIFRTNAGAYPIYTVYSANIKFIRPTMVGGALAYAAVTNPYIEDPIYADSFHTTSSATVAPYGVINIGAGCVNSEIKGGNWWSGISDMNIDTAFLYIIGATDTRWHTCGTPTVPIVGGTTNRILYAVSDAGNNIGIEIKRVYFDDLGALFYPSTNSSKGVVIENCAGAYADTNTYFDCLDGLTKGLNASGVDTSFTSVYGTIFYNIFTATTTGRVGLTFNEETATYAIYVDKMGLTGASGFSSTGSLYLYNLNDVIEYEFPYYVLGYTAFASSNVVTGGSGTANLAVKYQIDINDGNGYGGTWKTATSANLSAETINETDGFKLKIQITCTTAGTNYLNSLYFSMVTTSTAQYTNYPLDTYTLTLTGLQTGSRVAFLEAGTETLLADVQSIVGDSTSYTYPDTLVGNNIDIAILAPYYKYLKVENYTLGDANASIPITQTEDLIYITATSSKFEFDGDGSLYGTAHRMYGKASEVSGGVFEFTQEEMYDEWFDWALDDNNLRYSPAFRNTGGDDIGGGSYVGNYIFLMNDVWKGIPPDVDPVIVQVTGSFYGDNPLVATMEMIAGNTTTLLIRNSALAIGIETGGGGGATASEVWSYATRALTDKAGFSISGTKTTLDALNDISTAQVNTEVDTALADYDPPTKAELDTAQSAIQADIADVPTASENADEVMTRGLLKKKEFMALK
jgi:hypothetical protein